MAPKDQFEKFSDALRHILKVTPAELKTRMSDAKQARAKRSADRKRLMERRAVSASRRTQSK